MTVWIAKDVMHRIHIEASHIYPLESGGVLLGWRSGKDRVVADMRGPGEYALHGRYRLVPDHAWQLHEIREAFRISGGDLDYLGDWHSHPDGVAAMSPTDAKTLFRIARHVRDPLMLIVANAQADWSLGCWMGERMQRFSRTIDPVPQSVSESDAVAAWSAACT